MFSERQSKRRIGVSLIEMMIVVAIIGVLIALLVPAIQAVRNSAKKVQNQNNMRQILLAVQNYVVQNNGKLPQLSPWPGTQVEDCPSPGNSNYTYTETGTQYQTGWTVKYSCPGSVTTSVTSVWTQSGPNSWSGGFTTTKTYNKGAGRLDYIEGTPFFLLLPFMDYKGAWDASYGLMSQGALYKTGEPGSWGCLPANQQCDNWGNCWCTTTTWIPQNLTDTSAMTSMVASYGWQGGRSPSLVKPYLAYGDPTAEFPGMPAPLSYPLLGTFEGSIEDYNTAYQAFITEAYAGCGTGVPSSVNFNTGTYNSWAASAFLNIDFDPIPMTPNYATVQAGSGLGQGNKRIWTGIKSPDTQCDILSGQTHMGCNTQACMKARRAACSCAGIQADPGFPVGVTDLNGVAFSCGTSNGTHVDTSGYYVRSVMGLSHVPTSYYYGPISDYAKDYPDWCVPGGWAYDYIECHVGEWYYDWPYPEFNHNFWLDHPSPYAGGYEDNNGNWVVGCVASQPMSMVPGSLNIGFLDGSVMSVTKDMSPLAWAAMQHGESPGDADNW